MNIIVNYEISNNFLFEVLDFMADSVTRWGWASRLGYIEGEWLRFRDCVADQNHVIGINDIPEALAKALQGGRLRDASTDIFYAVRRCDVGYIGVDAADYIAQVVCFGEARYS